MAAGGTLRGVPRRAPRLLLAVSRPLRPLFGPQRIVDHERGARHDQADAQRAGEYHDEVFRGPAPTSDASQGEGIVCRGPPGP